MADEEKKTAAPTPEKPAAGEAPKPKQKRRMNAASLKNLKKGPPKGAGEKRAAPVDTRASAPTQEPKAPAKAGWSLFDGW